MNEAPKGLKKYESVLKHVCNVVDLTYLKDNEWEGCLGVACVLSYMEGVSPTVPALSRHLGLSPFNEHLIIAFDRLKINGVFGEEFNAKNDPVLKGEDSRLLKNKKVSFSHLSELAWCSIAGIAGNFIGLKEMERKEEVKNV